jgi:hypothetical protein
MLWLKEHDYSPANKRQVVKYMEETFEYRQFEIAKGEDGSLPSATAILQEYPRFKDDFGSLVIILKKLPFSN